MFKFMVFRLLEDAFINQIFIILLRQTKPPPPSTIPTPCPNSYHEPQGRRYLLFCFLIICPPPPAESAGVGNYVKAEFCFILFHYAYEREN